MRWIKINNVCLKKSRLLYWICKAIRLKGNFKINIFMKIHEDGRPDDGHAWITRDGKDFAFALKSLPYKIEKIGENEKYVYWIKSRDGLVDSQDGKKPVPIKTPKRNEYNN